MGPTFISALMTCQQASLAGGRPYYLSHSFARLAALFGLPWHVPLLSLPLLLLLSFAMLRCCCHCHCHCHCRCVVVVVVVVVVVLLGPGLLLWYGVGVGGGGGGGAGGGGIGCFVLAWSKFLTGLRLCVMLLSL